MCVHGVRANSRCWLMTGLVRVVVDLPGDVFNRLADISEQLEMRVSDYLIEVSVVAANRRDMDRDPIVGMWRERLTDKQIAARLNVTNRVVSERRRSYGLPPNKRSTR